MHRTRWATGHRLGACTGARRKAFLLGPESVYKTRALAPFCSTWEHQAPSPGRAPHLLSSFLGPIRVIEGLGVVKTHRRMPSLIGSACPAPPLESRRKLPPPQINLQRIYLPLPDRFRRQHSPLTVEPTIIERNFIPWAERLDGRTSSLNSGGKGIWVLHNAKGADAVSKSLLTNCCCASYALKPGKANAVVARAPDALREFITATIIVE